jgi:hypothetical protein
MAFARWLTSQTSLMISDRQKAALAWVLFALVVVSTAVQLWSDVTWWQETYDGFRATTETALRLVPLIFALVGALIISRQPRNAIGLLLLIPPLMSVIPVEAYARGFAAAPADPPLLLHLALWFSTWSWLLLIMPILFILVLFPTGRPLTPRWRWLIYWGLAMSAAFVVYAAFEQERSVAVEGGWTIVNPIGFIPNSWWEQYVALPWFTLLPALTLCCAAALFVRFRRSGAVEREQIKWLFYAGALFAVFYASSFLNSSWSDSTLWVLLLVVTLAAVPLAIGAAILRYRLFDIDIIIRRTLIYGLLTALLVAAYFTLVLLAQSAFVAVTGQESPLAIVISTLVIAASFNPLRRGIQAFIDRRFYRRRYDAEQILARFAQTARDEVNIERLQGELLSVVQETMQPEAISIWLKERRR